jgi:hypothetical protein
MANQEGIEPSATVGTLASNCWADYSPQSFAEAMVQVLQISAEAGEQGIPGQDGSDALQAEFAAVLVADKEIPVGVASIDMEVSLHGKIIQIVIPKDGVTPAYDEVVFPGMIENDTELIFGFNSENDGTPVAPTVQQAGWRVKVYEVKEVV